MPLVISAADLCAILLSFESIFDAALPTKFYEYLACGKPIIGVCRGELAHIINSKSIGRTADYGDIDKLSDIITAFKSSPSLMEESERNCYATLQDFSLDNISQRFLSVLNKEMDYKS
jgi:glycosyltransferase involved in cell wall biosynthesis